MGLIPPWKLVVITAILSYSGSWHFGYQLIVTNPTESIFLEFVNKTFQKNYGNNLTSSELEALWIFILNLTYIGGLIGTLASLRLMERFGRKRSFWVTLGSFSAGSLFSAASYHLASWELFAIGRFFSGIGAGIVVCLQPTYFLEICEPEHSGFLGSMTGIMVTSGLAFGSVMALPDLLGTSTRWYWLFYLDLLPNLLGLGLLPFLRESPKFVMSKYRDEKETSDILQYFEHTNIDRQIARIKEEIEAEKAELGLRDLCKKTYLRKGLILACLTQFGATFSGCAVIIFLSTHLFTEAGINEVTAGYATAGMGFLCVISTVACCFIVDQFGRKPLLLGSFIALAIVDLIFAIFAYMHRQMTASWPSFVCIATICLFAIIFGLGPNAIQWFIAAEITPQNARSAAMGFTMVVQWITSVAVVFIYSILESVLAEWTFLLFVVSLLFVVVYFWNALPETRNKDPLDVIKMLGYKAVHEVESGNMQ